MGIDDALYAGLLTSGEAVRQALLNPPDLWWAELGRRVFHLGPERDRPLLDGLPLVRGETPAEADFVLNTGPDDQGDPTDLGEFEAILQNCARYRLPMVCANPDLEVIRGDVRVLCAGALAARYRAIGGDVRSLGKPDPAIYQSVLRRIGLPPDRVLAVGDALRTDIAGATGVELASCWVLGGLHGATLVGPDRRVDVRLAEQEARDAGLAPVATVPCFAW
jgi:HAD superfamily hydrolase (TIGR01459 family)